MIAARLAGGPSLARVPAGESASQSRWSAWVIGAAAGGAVWLVACASDRGTIGAVLGQDSQNQLTVRHVPPKLGADQAGVKPGDEVLLIDGVDVRTLDARRVHELLSGEVGQSVKFTLVRNGRVLRVTVRRTPVERWRP
ncbi:PDZ domain-containing protein [Myxococcota bacterium]